MIYEDQCNRLMGEVFSNTNEIYHFLIRDIPPHEPPLQGSFQSNAENIYVVRMLIWFITH